MAADAASFKSVLECQRLGATGFDVGCETPGACRGAGYLEKLLANSSCERRQLRSGGLSPAYSTSFRACAGEDGVAITGSR